MTSRCRRILPISVKGKGSRSQEYSLKIEWISFRQTCRLRDILNCCLGFWILWTMWKLENIIIFFLQSFQNFCIKKELNTYNIKEHLCMNSPTTFQLISWKTLSITILNITQGHFSLHSRRFWHFCLFQFSCDPGLSLKYLRINFAFFTKILP